MRFLVIGLGSMGRRRVRLMKKIMPDAEIIGVDRIEERRCQAESEFGIETQENLSECLSLKKLDGTIVSTSPLSHAAIIKECLEANCNVFTEINLILDGYSENISLAKDRGKVLFLSSTFLYRNEIKYILSKLKDHQGQVNYNYHVGQYLPDWHPWESINNYFVGDKRTNGCRELFAIELPWLVKAFGSVVDYKVYRCKMSNLPVDYNDNYLLLLQHEGGNKGTLSVDVVSRKAVRNFELYGEDLYLTWDGSPSGLKQYDFANKQDVMIGCYDRVDKHGDYASFIIENAYECELRCFIREICGEKCSMHDFSLDMEIIKFIDEIENV